MKVLAQNMWRLKVAFDMMSPFWKIMSEGTHECLPCGLQEGSTPDGSRFTDLVTNLRREERRLGLSVKAKREAHYQRTGK
jgi:hypothetical protein